MMTRRFLFLGLLSFLSACNLKPLYMQDVNTSSAKIVYVGDVQSRFQQLIIRELVDGSSNFSVDESSSLFLLLTENFSTSAVLASKSGFNSRESIEVNVRFALNDRMTAKEVFSGTSFAIIPYDRGASEFSNIQAIENAQKRAAVQIAEDIRTRISAFLAGQ